jgi:hypothetical protein
MEGDSRARSNDRQEKRAETKGIGKPRTVILQLHTYCEAETELKETNLA